MYVGSRVSSTPDDLVGGDTATFLPVHDGMSGTSSATMSCSWPMISLRAVGSVSAELLVEELLTWVGVSVAEEPAVTDERGQVVVRVQDVGYQPRWIQVIGALLERVWYCSHSAARSRP